MSLVRRNIFANLIGGAWITALTVLLTPLQVNILGMEAYGVVGFITTLQVAFTAFDFGLSSTLTRQLAADQSDNKSASDELVRTATTIYWVAACVVGILLGAMSRPIAERWFNSNTLDVALLGQCLAVIAIYLALRWPVALYTGLLGGLQRMDVLNAVKVATTSLRLVGGIAVLLHWRSLYAFLAWTAFSAMVEVVAYWLACNRVHPTMPIRPGISWEALRNVWRFSVSMNALAILAVVIVQLDRLLISKLLTLDDLGHYNLAYTAASGISFVVVAVSSAVLPSLVAAHSADPRGTLMRHLYDRADRVMLTLAGLVAFALMFYGQPILALWVNRDAAAGANLPLALLAAGFWCGAVIANIYNAAVASGMLGRLLKVNALGILPYAVGMYLLIDRFGISGAAVTWLLLNVAYVALLAPPILSDVLDMSARRWLATNVLPFAAVGLVCFGLPSLAAQFYLPNDSSPWHAISLTLSVLLYGAASLYLLDLRSLGERPIHALLARLRP